MFSIRFKQLRELEGMTQRDAAVALKVSNGTIGNWESGKRTPDATMLMFIADYFHVSVDYLIGHDSPSVLPSPTYQITPHEQALIEAYRNHPDLCSAVDRLLEVAPLSPEDEANNRTVPAVVEAVLDIKKEGVPTK